MPSIAAASAFRFVRCKNSKKAVTWNTLKMRVSQRHRPSEPVGLPYRHRLSKTHAGRPVAIDLRPHWLAVKQYSNRNSGKRPMSKVLSVRQLADLDIN